MFPLNIGGTLKDHITNASALILLSSFGERRALLRDFIDWLILD